MAVAMLLLLLSLINILHPKREKTSEKSIACRDVVFFEKAKLADLNKPKE